MSTTTEHLAYILCQRLLLEARPLSVSDTFDVSGKYLKIIIELIQIILKFRFATIQIRQKYDVYRIRIAIWKNGHKL